MSPNDTQDDFDAAQDRARRDHESREQAADDRSSELLETEILQRLAVLASDHAHRHHKTVWQLQCALVEGIAFAAGLRRDDYLRLVARSVLLDLEREEP